jgi:hypothetical protein
MIDGRSVDLRTVCLIVLVHWMEPCCLVQCSDANAYSWNVIGCAGQAPREHTILTPQRPERVKTALSS